MRGARFFSSNSADITTRIGSRKDEQGLRDVHWEDVLLSMIDDLKWEI